MATNYIYIMTDIDAPEGNVVIGYTDDIDARLQLVNGPAVVGTYTVYATYKVPVGLQPDRVQALLDALFPNKRKGRELFDLTAEEAYAVLEAAAAISGTTDNLTRGKPTVNKQRETTGTIPSPEQLTMEDTEQKKTKASKRTFKDRGIPVGAVLVFIKDHNKQVTVLNEDNLVLCDGKKMKLSRAAIYLSGHKKVSGPNYFMYQGVRLANIDKQA